MVDQVLRIGIDSTQAENGARRVSASLKQIQRDAAKAMNDGKGIPVELDTSGIAGAGDEVNRAIQDILRRVGDGKIPLGFDVDNLSDEANRVVREIREEFDRNLRDGIPIETSLKVLTESVESEIDRVLSDASKEVSISVSADTAAAQREIDRLRDNLRGPGLDGATVRLDADASDVVREAGRAEDAIREVADAADDLSRIGGIGIDVSDVAADAGRAAAGLDKVSDNAKKAAVSAKEMENAFLGALQAEEMLELVGEALLAIATSIGTAIVAFEDYQDAVRAATGDSEAATVAMEMIEQFASDTAFSIEDVTAAFVKFRSAGLEASKEALTSYGNVAAGLNLTMEELASAVGDAAEGNFSKLNDTQLKAVESGDKVKFTYQGVTTEVANTGKAVAEFIKKMGNVEFAGLMEEQAAGVTGALEAMSEAWQELSRDMGEGGLSQGLIEFSHSMKAASEAADELGRLLGGWLGAEMTALGRFVETTVKEINGLIDAFQWLADAINSIPSISSALGSVRDYLSENIAPNLFVNTPEAGEEQGPPTAPDRVNSKAFGSDTDLPRQPKRTGRATKTPEQRQAENFSEQTANNKELIRTLTLMDEAYERGRYAVEGFRNSVEELNIRQTAQKSVGKENAEAIVEQAMAIKYLQESMAFKGEILGQQEAIIQTVELAEAYKSGADAVEQAEAKQKAYNTAVKLGGVNMPGFIDQLTELEAAAKEANDNLKLEQDLSGLDQQIEATARMATAYREGGGAVREAALEQQVYAAALAAGEADEEDSIARIREKMTALRDLQEIQQSDERAMMAGFDLEQMEGELRISQMVGEARYIEAERLEMLTNKKRETKDATAELTAEEERLAEAMGRATAAMAGQSSALEDLANSIPNIAYAFEEATASGLMHFEDALVSIVTGTKSAREAFADMAKSIAADLARMAIRMAIIQPLAMMFGGMGGMAGGMVATGAPMALGGVYHTGGIVGADPVPMRALPKFHTGGIVGADDANPHPFATFPKFHTGGLASSETPAVLQKGEGVFTKAQMAALQPVNNNNTSAPVTINVSVAQAQGSDPSVAENQGRIIAKQVEMAMNDHLIKAQRPGGILNANGGY